MQAEVPVVLEVLPFVDDDRVELVLVGCGAEPVKALGGRHLVEELGRITAGLRNLGSGGRIRPEYTSEALADYTVFVHAT